MKTSVDEMHSNEQSYIQYAVAPAANDHAVVALHDRTCFFHENMSRATAFRTD